MTLFAVSIAGLFPILHLGRPQYFYWLAPYPNTMALWPQWRSALVWDFWAILSYLLFSILFFYVGLHPRPRDHARPRALGARAQRSTASSRSAGAARPGTGRRYETLHRTLAALARAARRLGALHRRPRLRGEPDARLAGEHLPALLRRRRAVLRLRAWSSC